MNQDLVFCDSQHQQSGCILWAQVQQQRGEASTTKVQKHKALGIEAAATWASTHDDFVFLMIPHLKGSGEDTGWLSNRLSCGESCRRREGE